jgi:hypothetical protein
MPHRGQETVIRVLRLWCWRDIPRRARPTRGVSLLRAPRLANLSPFCDLHPAVRATKVIVRGAYAGPRTLDCPPSGTELIHVFWSSRGITCRALRRRSTPVGFCGNDDGAALVGHHDLPVRRPHRDRRLLQQIRSRADYGRHAATSRRGVQLSAPPALPAPLRLPGRVHDQLM